MELPKKLLAYFVWNEMNIFLLYFIVFVSISAEKNQQAVDVEFYNTGQATVSQDSLKFEYYICLPVTILKSGNPCYIFIMLYYHGYIRYAE